MIKVTIKVTTKEEITVDFDFPFYRSYFVGEDHYIYYKFENIHKISIIEENDISTIITGYDDFTYDYFSDVVTEEMLYGVGAYDKITEKDFDNVVERLIKSITQI